MSDIVDRLRKLYTRNGELRLDGVVVVSPKLLEEAIAAIEAAREPEIPTGVEYRILPKKWEYRSKTRYYQDEKQYLQARRSFESWDSQMRYEVRTVGEWRDDSETSYV